MIPKVIHYCWFGNGEKNEMINRCIQSWKQYCPDYEIIEWNESNYDVNKHPFMKKAYKNKTWAYVSDYARIDILNEYGGIYLDTDVELLKNLDPFLNYDLFAGFESDLFVAFGLGFGSIKGNKVLREILDYYDTLEFPDVESGISMISCPRIQTEVLMRHGIVCNNQNQESDGCHIFRTEYFCPMSFITGKTNITDKTVSIHHYDMSWKNDNYKRIKKIQWKCIGIFGEKVGKILAMIIIFPMQIYNNMKKGTLSDYLETVREKCLK